MASTPWLLIVALTTLTALIIVLIIIILVLVALTVVIVAVLVVTLVVMIIVGTREKVLLAIRFFVEKILQAATYFSS